MGNWALNALEANISVDKTLVNEESAYIKSGEWTLNSFSCRSINEIFKCCPESYSLVYCDIVITRMSLFYVFNLILPCILLLMIGSLSFCLPPESGERVSLSVTILLAMMVFIMVLMEQMPPTSKVVPLMGKYDIYDLSTKGAHFLGLGRCQQLEQGGVGWFEISMMVNIFTATPLKHVDNICISPFNA